MVASSAAASATATPTAPMLPANAYHMPMTSPNAATNTIAENNHTPALLARSPATTVWGTGTTPQAGAAAGADAAGATEKSACCLLFFPNAMPITLPF